MRTARQKTTEKGRRTMKIARRLLESRGALVEQAVNAVRWLPTPGGVKPMSMKHDFFGIWDAVCVNSWSHTQARKRRRVYFVQVTDVDNMSHRRAKILESGFPCSSDDLILGQRPRTRKFRVLRGPLFSGPSEEWLAPREERPCIPNADDVTSRPMTSSDSAVSAAS